nr:ribonuclease H-like domain-containing protein [Tanacetum cinerariifolium]
MEFIGFKGLHGVTTAQLVLVVYEVTAIFNKVNAAKSRVTTAVRVSTDGWIKWLEDQDMRAKELKICSLRSTSALLNKDQLKFHSYQDAKLLMEAIEKRYGGNKESKKVKRTLFKQQYENFVASSLETLDSAVYMSDNPVQHQRTKNIEIDIHFVRDMVTVGHVRVLYAPSRFQYADIFTKELHCALFKEFRSSLSVGPPPAPTARAY